MSDVVAELLFDGPIAKEYELLHLICPAATDISRRVGEFVGNWQALNMSGKVDMLEIGCGTGITTKRLLHHCPDAHLVCIDNAPDMLKQAAVNLDNELAKNRLELLEMDALSYLQTIATASLDIVVSAYTIHNFLDYYRTQVLAEIYRVLKSGGLFVNGDRYAEDNSREHLKLVQAEVRDYCRVFTEIQRPDMLTEWIVHLFSDESPDHIMRLKSAIQTMEEIGFQSVSQHFRQGVNTLLSAKKAD